MENFANFLFLFNQETRKLIRNIENIEKKLINCQLAVVFNETCLNEDILPIYTNIYMYRSTNIVHNNDTKFIAVSILDLVSRILNYFTLA